METLLALLLPLINAIICGLMQHRSKTSPVHNLLMWISGLLAFILFFGLFMNAGASLLGLVFASGSQHLGLLLFLVAAALSGLLSAGIADITHHVYMFYSIDN